MAPEPEDWIKPTRSGRRTGLSVYIDGITLEYMLMYKDIPIDTPTSQLRVKRYPTKKGTIMIVIKRLKKDECPVCGGSGETEVGEMPAQFGGKAIMGACQECEDWIHHGVN